MAKYPELAEEFSSRYASALKVMDHSHIIIDNPALSLPSEIGNKLEITTYLSTFPNISSMRLFITDITTHHLDNTIKYMDLLDAGIKQIPSAKVNTQCLAVNMTPPGWNISNLPNFSVKMSQGKLSCGFTLPFKDELFQFSGTMEDLPRLSQIEMLANNIVQKKFNFKIFK